MQKIVLTNDLPLLTSLIREFGIKKLMSTTDTQGQNLLHFACESHSLQVFISHLKNCDKKY